MAKKLKQWLEEFASICGFEPADINKWGQENILINLVMNGNINPNRCMATRVPDNYYDTLDDYWERFHDQYLSLPNAEIIGTKAFEEFTKTQDLLLPRCKIIGDDAFRQGSYTKVEAPLCESIGRRAFGGNGTACSYYFPNLKFIGKEAFNTTKPAEYYNIFLYGENFCELEEKGSLKVDSVPEVNVYVNPKLYDRYMEDANWQDAIAHYDNLHVRTEPEEIIPLPLNQCTIQYAKKMVKQGNYHDVWAVGDTISLGIYENYSHTIYTHTATLIDMNGWNGLDVVFQLDWCCPQKVEQYMRMGWLSDYRVPYDYFANGLEYYRRYYSTPDTGYLGILKRDCLLINYDNGVWYNGSSYKHPNGVRSMFFIPTATQLLGEAKGKNETDGAIVDNHQFEYYKTLDFSTLTEISSGIEWFALNSLNIVNGYTKYLLYNVVTGEFKGSQDLQTNDSVTSLICFGFNGGE